MDPNTRRLLAYRREMDAQRDADPYPAHTQPPADLPAWVDYLCIAAIWAGAGLPFVFAVLGG